MLWQIIKKNYLGKTNILCCLLPGLKLIKKLPLNQPLNHPSNQPKNQKILHQNHFASAMESVEPSDVSARRMDLTAASGVPVMIVTICTWINLIFNNNMNKHHMYFLFFQSCISVMFWDKGRIIIFCAHCAHHLNLLLNKPIIQQYVWPCAHWAHHYYFSNILCCALVPRVPTTIIQQIVYCRFIVT